MEPLKFSKYQYSIGLVTFASPVSGRFGEVEVGDMLGQQRTGLLLRKELALVIVDGRRSRFSIQELVDPGERGTQWASQPTRTTLITEPGSEPLTSHEFLEFSRSANVVTGPVFPDSTFAAVIKSLVRQDRYSDRWRRSPL